MTLALTVDTAAWEQRVRATASACPGLVPVVKGNGYGFGLRALCDMAARLGDTVSVGTVHELGDVPAALTPVVLTPTLAAPDDTRPILTVGSALHVERLCGWRGRVLVKLRSSMGRFGVDPADLGALVHTARAAQLELAGFSIHLPLAGSDDERLDEIAAWLSLLDPTDELWVSHLEPGAYAALLDAWPDRRFRLRLGTALWHAAARSSLHLGADVIDVRPVRGESTAGYRLRPVDAGGRLAVVGAGTAHGVHPLPDGRSPFHFARRRLALVEPPHMHVSMVVVPAGEPAPGVGEMVDVQVPLTHALVDVVRWR